MLSWVLVGCGRQVVRGLPGRVTHIAAGSHHSIVLLEDGRVMGWGASATGQLGHKKVRRGVIDDPFTCRVPSDAAVSVSSIPSSRQC